MKKRCLALLLTLVLCIGMAIPAGASQFQDVPDGHWASDAVDYVVEKGLFNGTSATTFSPDSGMTRAMLTVVLYRYAGSPAVTGTVASETPFQDIPEGAYYGDAVVWAYQNDIFPDWIVSQDGGDHNRTTFAPDSPTPRMDFAQMLYQFSLYLTGEAPAEAGEELPFVDVTQEALYQVLAAAYPYYLSDEADVAQIQAAVSWAYTQGIMNGTSATTLSPDRTITRAQVAVMLMRFDGAYGEVHPPAGRPGPGERGPGPGGAGPPDPGPKPHPGGPGPGRGTARPLLPHPARRAELLHRPGRGRRGLPHRGGEHRRRLRHPGGRGGWVAALRRPPGQHPQRGLHPDGGGPCPGCRRIRRLLGAAVRGLTETKPRKGLKSADFRPFFCPAVLQ